MLATMPNERPLVPTWIENRLELPRCCPVSGNPQPGSCLTVRYRVAERVLEVFHLKRYVEQFIGGHPDGTRNMETMVQKIAADCAGALGVRVTVRADLLLVPYQRMKIVCRAGPDAILPGNPSGVLAGAGVGAAVRLPAAVDEAQEFSPGIL